MCRIVGKERAIYDDDDMMIVNTKKLKGHKRRIMCIIKRHDRIPTEWELRHMISRLFDIGLDVFKYAMAFAILDNKYAAYKTHFHLVASDFDGDDFWQIMKTPILAIFSTKLREKYAY